MNFKTGKKIISGIENFLFERPWTSNEFLSFFRITIGLFILLHHFSVLSDLHILYGFHAVVPSEVNNLYVDPYVLTASKINRFLKLDESTFWLAFNILYISLAAFIAVGFLTKLSVIIMIFLHTALIQSGVFFTYGADFFLSMSLFYLLLFPVEHHLSVDSKIFTIRIRENYVIYRRFLQLHLAIAYSFSGFDKMLGINWRNGESIWKSLTLPYSNMDFQLNFSGLAHTPILLVIAGWTVILIEMCYPIIFFKPLKKIWLGLTISMHMGIMLVLNLYFFSTIMIIWNIAAFYNFEPVKVKSIKPALDI